MDSDSEYEPEQHPSPPKKSKLAGYESGDVVPSVAELQRALCKGNGTVTKGLLYQLIAHHQEELEGLNVLMGALTSEAPNGSRVSPQLDGLLMMWQAALCDWFLHYSGEVWKLAEQGISPREWFDNRHALSIRCGVSATEVQKMYLLVKAWIDSHGSTSHSPILAVLFARLIRSHWNSRRPGEEGKGQGRGCLLV